SLSFSGARADVENVAGITDLNLKINRVSGKIQEGMPVLTIEAKLTLFNNGEIPLTLSYPGLVINLGKWDYTFRGSKITISGSTLDLSRSGGVVNQEVDASWQGIYIAQGSFKLNGVDFKVRDCYLDSQGFTGKIAGSAENEKFLGNISFERLSLEIDIRHDQDIRNFVKIEGCSFPPLQSPLTLTGILDKDKNCYNLSVDTSNNPIVKYAELGLIVSITRGQFFLSSGKYVLWLDGALGFDHAGLPRGIIQFHNLGIDTDGNFIFPETGLQVDSPSPLDFGDLFKCEVSSVQFLRDSNNKLKIQFDGALSLGADIPLNGKISFQELSLEEGPKVTLSGVSADFSLKGVARISGNLDKNEENGKEYLSGGAALYLFGASAPLGGGFGFKVYSYRSWAVAGEVELGVPLNIPNTNLFIYSFSGGVGRNVNKKTDAAFDFQNINTSPEANNWLFMGGIRLGTFPPMLLDCYPLQLTVGFPQLSFSLYGQCKIVEGPTITSTIDFNPLVPLFNFTSQTKLDLYGVIKVQGGMRVFAGKENGKPAVILAIGWPYPENAVGYSMLNGTLYGRFGLYGYASSDKTVEVKANAGCGLNVGIFKGEIEGELNFIINSDPFLSGQVNAEGEIDVWVGALGASGELGVKLYKEPHLDYDGEVSGWVKILGKKMEISKHVKGDISYER
ncbi:MAG: hypothetical protein ACUVWQ_11910, partial [Candidatus Aminicenantales bacterium]